MVQCIAKAAEKAISAPEEIEAHVDALLAWLRPQLIELVQSLHQERTPSRFLVWEFALMRLLREFGRLTLELLLNDLEGDGAHLPPDVVYLGQGYRRLKKKTRNAHVSTLFGKIVLYRFPYRFWLKNVNERGPSGCNTPC